MHPECEDERWRISNVEKHLLRERPDGSRPIYLKVQYADGDKAYHSLDVVRTHDPMIAARYAINKGIAGTTGCEWVSKYLETDPLCQHLTRIYKMTTEGTTKYKFGVEAPRSPKHALEIDAHNKNTGWRDSLGLEVKQLNDYSTFLVHPDGKPIPRGYKRIPYHVVSRLKSNH